MDDWNTEESECGTLYTLGYEHRIGSERFRAEIFGGNMAYDSTTTVLVTDPNTGEQTSYVENMKAVTSQFGCRGEFEYLWDTDLFGWTPLTFFAGIGTRVWSRNIHDGTTTSGPVIGLDVSGYIQTWWTIYPYVGLDKRWVCSNGNEFFVTSRIGCTALTYSYTPYCEVIVTDPTKEPIIIQRPAYYMNPGLTGQIECGLRRNHFVISAYFESMAWQNSQAEHHHGDSSSQLYYYPGARMYTTGLKLGINY